VQAEVTDFDDDAAGSRCHQKFLAPLAHITQSHVVIRQSRFASGNRNVPFQLLVSAGGSHDST
jgi:hypothetical protein